MENDWPEDSIGQWAEVLRRLKRLSDLDLLLTGSALHSSPPHRGHHCGLGLRTLRPILQELLSVDFPLAPVIQYLDG